MTGQPTLTLGLPDGRNLAYCEFGDPGGRAVFYFHGFPGSRLEGRLVHPIAARHGARVIALDRPGYGRSDFKPGRTLLDWADDVEAAADALSLGRFLVVGVSGGGPYAAACAYRLPHRLDGAAIICGMGPVDDPAGLDGMLAFNRVGLRAARRAPWVVLPILALVAPMMRRHARWFVHRLAERIAAPDRAFFARSENAQIFEDTFREAFRAGPRGPARDVRLYAMPWGFRLEDVRTPVRLWHGDLDHVVPSTMGRRVAAALPNCVASFFPDDGHFSLALGRAEEIFRGIRDLAD